MPEKRREIVMEVNKALVELIKRFLVKEESFESHIPTLCIKWDRIPNPTVEERQVSEVPCLAHRAMARNILGKLLLKYRWKRGGFGGPSSLTQNGTVLEVYPLPADWAKGGSHGSKVG